MKFGCFRGHEGSLGSSWPRLRRLLTTNPHRKPAAYNAQCLGFNFHCKVLILTATCLQVVAASGQVNSWTKPTSGDWEELTWSLGMLPGPGQSVLITNQGSKAVAITAGTAENFPASLQVNSITLGSPANSFNTLLMNYAGVETPLTVNTLVISSNSAMSLIGSSLVLNGPAGVGMSIGGEFNQDASSIVSGNQLDVGYIGPGIFALSSGILSVGNVWVGGPFQGVLRQTGGSNLTGIVHLESGGLYDLSGGVFSSALYSDTGSLLLQRGGLITTNLQLWRGGYILEEGINSGGVTVPVTDGYSLANGNASVLQTGGTNLGSIQLGVFGTGTYTLSNGVVLTPALEIGYYGNFVQSGGTQSCTGTTALIGGWVDGGDRALGYANLTEGQMSCQELYLETGSFTQGGGTNMVAGDVNLATTTHNYYYLNGGVLGDANTTMGAAWVGGFFQTGGQHHIANQLTIEGTDLPFWQGYVLSGGQLVVSNIVLNSGGRFTRTGGTVSQSGLLTLVGGQLTAGPAQQHFGSLQLATAETTTNSSLIFPTNPCVVVFASSQNQSWVPEARLVIENWAGATFGGGSHQLIFGQNAAALSSRQVNQIVFHNPAGVPPGLYSGLMLGSGEVVPNALPLTGHIPPTLRLFFAPGALRLVVYGETDANYGVEVSGDFINWLLWTNGIARNGSLAVEDPTTTNRFRFYRAVLLP